MSNETDGLATSIIRLTKPQVRNAMMAVVDDLQDDFPEPDEALNVAEAIGTLFERTLIKEHVIPRIPDSIDLNWLKANDIPYAVKSSIAQFVSKQMIRVQILSQTHRKRFKTWKES